jgi:predicted MFS family arabinose efflux permease
LRDLGYTNVASLTGLLIAGYGLGLVISSPGVAWAGELTRNRSIGLIIALWFMIGAIVCCSNKLHCLPANVKQIMFMLSKTFALLFVARILQGFSGTVVWCLALALISDSVEPELTGEAFGIVMIGFSVGSLAGAPIGGE